MKKNLLTVLLAASLVVSMVACGGNDAADNNAANNDAVNTEVNTEVVADTEVVVDTEVVADTEVEAATGYVMYSSIWDKVQMTFAEDGTCVFEMPEYKIAENCTWTYAEGVLTVTREDGVAFTSYMAEDGTTLKLDYTALANEQLVGQFDTADLTFFGGASTEVASDVPVFACDWICTITFNADGTYAFDLADYQIKEEGTWAMDAEGVITVTKPSGNTCVSYIGEDGLVHLDYVADASEQLVGQFYIAE